MVCGGHLDGPSSTGGAETAPSVAIDSKGDAVVAWEAPAGDGLISRGLPVPQAVPGIKECPIGDGQAVKNIAPSVAFAPTARR